MRTTTALAVATTLTAIVLLTPHMAVLFPPIPEPAVACDVASVETTVAVSPMGPDYIAPPPVVPVS